MCEKWLMDWWVPLTMGIGAIVLLWVVLPLQNKEIEETKARKKEWAEAFRARDRQNEARIAALLAKSRGYLATEDRPLIVQDLKITSARPQYRDGHMLATISEVTLRHFTAPQTDRLDGKLAFFGTTRIQDWWEIAYPVPGVPDTLIKVLGTTLIDVLLQADLLQIVEPDGPATRREPSEFAKVLKVATAKWPPPKE